MSLAFLANPDCDIYFRGWESSTAKLGREGWSVSFEEDYIRDEKRVVLYDPKTNLKMYGMSRGYREGVQQSLYTREYMTRGYPTEFHITHASNELVMQIHESIFPRFDAWSDTRTRLVKHETMYLKDIKLFQELAKPVAQELIVEPQEVSELLERIMRMQSPGQAEIRAKNKVPTVHASIMSFERAA